MSNETKLTEQEKLLLLDPRMGLTELQIENACVLLVNGKRYLALDGGHSVKLYRQDYSDERLNETVSDEKEEFYRGATIKAYKTQWDGYDAIKDKTKRMYEIKCSVDMQGLGLTKLPERNDGGKLTSVNEAINQVKSLIDACIENKWLCN